MHVIIISESLIIRKGIEEILKREEFIKSISSSYIFSDIHKDNYDLVIIDLNKNNKQYLCDIEQIKQKINTKIMILDFYKDGSIFSECMKIGVDGYILANRELKYISYVINHIYKGKKYYDSDLIEEYFSKDNQKCVEELTKREKEILLYITRGNSNKEISKLLFITQHTVKKHTSNILRKLNLKDRMELTLYARSNGIV